MKCESCDNTAIWSVCVDEKCNTKFGVCDDCFNKNKVCWTSFARATCWYCDDPIDYGLNWCSYECMVNDCGCKGDPTCCGQEDEGERRCS